MQHKYLISISALVLASCSGSSNEPDELPGPSQQFTGTWEACTNSSTAESVRSSFIYDGATVAFVEEYIAEIDCFNPPLGFVARTGTLEFESPITDDALGFIAYPIIFSNSDAESANTRDLIYTDSSILYLGDPNSRLSENEAPTALNTQVIYYYQGAADFSLPDSQAAE